MHDKTTGACTVCVVLALHLQRFCFKSCATCASRKALCSIQCHMGSTGDVFSYRKAYRASLSIGDFDVCAKTTSTPKEPFFYSAQRHAYQRSIYPLHEPTFSASTCVLSSYTQTFLYLSCSSQSRFTYSAIASALRCFRLNASNTFFSASRASTEPGVLLFTQPVIWPAASNAFSIGFERFLSCSHVRRTRNTVFFGLYTLIFRERCVILRFLWYVYVLCPHTRNFFAAFCVFSFKQSAIKYLKSILLWFYE